MLCFVLERLKWLLLCIRIMVVAHMCNSHNSNLEMRFINNWKKREREKREQERKKKIDGDDVKYVGYVKEILHKYK